MEPTHPIFHTFFEINSLDHFPQAYNAGRPVFRGLFENNDPAGRLLMIVNYNTDISRTGNGRAGLGLRRDERGLQAGRELRCLRTDALSSPATEPTV